VQIYLKIVLSSIFHLLSSSNLRNDFTHIQEMILYTVEKSYTAASFILYSFLFARNRTVICL